MNLILYFLLPSRITWHSDRLWLFFTRNVIMDVFLSELMTEASAVPRGGPSLTVLLWKTSFGKFLAISYPFWILLFFLPSACLTVLLEVINASWWFTLSNSVFPSNFFLPIDLWVADFLFLLLFQIEIMCRKLSNSLPFHVASCPFIFYLFNIEYEKERMMRKQRLMP